MSGKDPVAVLDPKTGAAKSGRREAIGAEIPVTVHASRTSQGLGKNLPSVHEDTKTVIVLQQGAVVRLTASLNTGETVVLTNRMTGADVLCRVGNIKSQQGIQHYIDLEFIQRAPGFWGDTVAASSAPLGVEASPVSVWQPAPLALVPVAAMPASLPPPVAVPPQSAAAIEEELSAAAFVAPPVFLPQAAAPTAPEPAAIPDLPPAPPAEVIQQAVLAEPVATLGKPSPTSAPVLVPAPISIAASAPSFREEWPAAQSGGSSSGSSKALLGIAAAVALVLAGAAGGYWVFNSQKPASSGSAQQVAIVPAVQPAPDLTTINTFAMEPESSALSIPVSEPQMDVVIESRPTVADVPARAQPAPAPVAAARTPAPAARRPVVRIEQLKAPKAKTAAARSDVGDPMPMMLGGANLSDAAAGGTLLATAAVGPAPPPTVGGQLQSPQLLNSTPAVYPATARSQRVQGTVVLDVLVDETGNVAETKVVAGPAPLLLAAQDAVRTWKYKPALLNGKPIAVHTKVSVRFSLQ